MDQDSGENGTKENQKPVTSKPGNSRTGNSIGPGMAMKIPKQPTKSTAVPKKGRQTKTSKDVGPDNPNAGNIQSRGAREGHRAVKDEKSRLSPPLSQRQSKDLNRSRPSSTSPIRRKDSGDASDDRPKDEEEAKVEEAVDVNDIEASSESLKQLLSIGGSNSSRIVYSRIQLLNISENPSSKNRPECLESDFNATNGRWDPETWHRSLSSPPPTSATSEKPSKFPLSENRDRFTDDATSSGIILGPQRRSFQDGCHVTNNSSSRSTSKLHMPSTTEPSRHTRPRLLIRQRSEITDHEGPPPGRDRQIESASALRTEEFDWDRRTENKSRYGERDLSDLRPEPRRPRDLPKNLHELRSGNVRDRDNDREYKDFRDRDYRERKFSHSREFGSERVGWYQNQPRDRREQRFSNNEPEPEWYTDGPTSQSDTIDLAGFTDETPVAAADFSSWGGGIPMDDIEDPDEDKKEGAEEVKGEKEKGVEKKDSLEEGKAEADDKKQSKSEETQPSANDEADASEADIPEFAAVMEEILKEDMTQTSDGAGDETLVSGLSKFSQWFQRENILKKDSGSGVSTPHEELENIAELTAEQGLGSPADLDGKQQIPGKADILRYLAQMKASSGNLSPSLKLDPAEQQEILRQQMKLGSVMTAADIEASVGARHSPSQSYGGVDMQNTDAFNKLVASIREKDKIRQQQQVLAQQAILQGKSPAELMAGLTMGRTPSPDDPSTHNVLQQSVLKKQLEMQKVAYKEKIRLMEQRRREEQLREAIRTADAKMFESTQMNKSLSFMPTSVMRKMQESRDGKMPGEDMLGGPMGEADDLASATASFSAKLANSGKRLPTPTDQMPHQANDLLARIYQSAAQPKRQDSSSGLRRNASYPEVLNRGSAFHQPSRQNMGLDLNVRGDVDVTRLRLQEMQNAGLLRQHSKPGNLSADVYNTNILKNESMKYGRSSPRSLNDLSEKRLDADMDRKNQHEVAVLTQSVLKQFGITEEQLSRLTPQQQHTVVQVIQRRYIELQTQKQMLNKKPSPHGSKSLDAKNELHNAAAGKQLKHDDPQNNPALLKSLNAMPLGIKFAPQPAPGIPGVTAPGPIPGMLPTTNPQLHPYQLRVAQPLPFIQPMPRGAPVVPAAFLPTQPHIPGRILPSNVPLASPIANQAAALMQMQLAMQQQQQQQQQRLYAAAIQQQQLQVLAAARQKDSREFNNPLERWFGRDILSQSQLPPHKPLMHLADVERVNQQNKE